MWFPWITEGRSRETQIYTLGLPCGERELFKFSLTDNSSLDLLCLPRTDDLPYSFQVYTV